MDAFGGKWDDDECSVIGDKGEVGFIDFDDDKSVCDYKPDEEGPIIISVPFPLVRGQPQSVFVGETAAESITVQNTTNDPIELWGVKVYASNPEKSFTLSLVEPCHANSNGKAAPGFLESFSLEDRVLQPGETLTIWLSCKPKEIGMHTSIVHFDLETDKIERVVFLLAEDKISHALASKAPYSKSLKKKLFTVDAYVKGSRPSAPPNRFFKKRLPRYDIPIDIRESLESKRIPDDILQGLTGENYSCFYKTLLIMEELQLEEDMRTYDMEHVTLKRRGSQFLSLVVPGLAERRPSLVHGDYIFAKLPTEYGDNENLAYQGYIHRVEADEVYLKFSPEFHLSHVDGNVYNVHFTYNRINMRRLYQAVDAAAQLETGFLFPSETCENRLIRRTPFAPISCHLNEEQILSVEMILGCKGMPPYLIYGPPGTGKTMTVVEAILQLYKTRKSSRILVCAPSNSAADHIVEKLLSEKAVEVRENDLFRLNAATRPFEEVNPNHIRFCFFNDHIFQCPPSRALLRYRIIISTYMSASLLYAEGVRRGQFSHIFLDEAGQASEPETMIPLSNLCKLNTVVVLAGDPMQLGPVVYSIDAESNGLGKSYLERLFECDLYSNGDENYMTKLIRNYRCHPEILYLPSQLFYKGELIACKDYKCPLLEKVDLLPNKEFPVLFFGIQGFDEREGNNPSWFNRVEASKVVDVIQKLTSSWNFNEEDIGVIAPYRQQVLKLKKTLEDLDLPDVKVGSVEQFQGQEKQVIIISTVRSTIKHNEFDRNHCLGFLSNSRRFNVAITRAISLLVIIGNPHIISMDAYWNKLLWHCADNNSYKGCPLPERQEFDDENPSPEDQFNDYSEENPLSSKDIECSVEEILNTDIPQVPVTDEAEWSDGWK